VLTFSRIGIPCILAEFQAMDGPIRLRQRMLSIQFQNDRHAHDRIELAYRRIEMLSIASDHPKDSVQLALPMPLTTANFTSEIQG
jgi:hypothetical protein